MRLVFVSDTHLQHAFDVPNGDVLMHCGDGTWHGTAGEIRQWNEWFQKQPHRHKVAIAGNHDWGFQTEPETSQQLLSAPIYLQDSATIIEGIIIYGSPWQPWFHNWAFNLPRGRAISEKWALIPEDVDVLVTHGPPHGILDENLLGEHCGCEELLEAVRRIKPKVHAFGHIHCAHGTHLVGETFFVNASICTELYEPRQAPIVVDLDDKPGNVVRKR